MEHKSTTTEEKKLFTNSGQLMMFTSIYHTPLYLALTSQFDAKFSMK